MYKFFNPHPDGKIVGDCVKRAITIATGKDYKQVQLELNRYKKITGAKVYNEDKNWKPYVENVIGAKKESHPAERGMPRMNGQRFCESHPKGTYILRMAGHLACCKNGVIYDTWDCSEKCVCISYKVK